ncbi:AAA family ATPase [Candidatus Acetothermia bacterium]|nr:AAA family ATPase [Candidatus Acetothermia bacterium]
MDEVLLLVNAPNDTLSSDAIYRELRAHFSSWRGFKPYYVHQLGKLTQHADDGARANDQLQMRMGNLPELLLYLRDNQESVYKDIKEIFQVAVLPEGVGRFMINETESQVFISLTGSRGSAQYWLADWPDGWKAFLSWLVALRTAPPGAVIYLEEPENNLHPRLIAQILEQVEIANERGVQVFISTHSMELVNMIEPNELILMQDGQAYRLDPEKADKIREAGILLGSAWTSDFLEAAKKE